jgi:hypothetical protein
MVARLVTVRDTTSVTLVRNVKDKAILAVQVNNDSKTRTGPSKK